MGQQSLRNHIGLINLYPDVPYIAKTTVSRIKPIVKATKKRLRSETPKLMNIRLPKQYTKINTNAVIILLPHKFMTDLLPNSAENKYFSLLKSFVAFQLFLPLFFCSPNHHFGNIRSLAGLSLHAQNHFCYAQLLFAK